MPQIKIGKGIGDISEQTLRFYRQIGVDAVVMPTRMAHRTGNGRTQTGTADADRTKRRARRDMGRAGIATHQSENRIA